MARSVGHSPAPSGPPLSVARRIVGGMDLDVALPFEVDAGHSQSPVDPPAVPTRGRRATSQEQPLVEVRRSTRRRRTVSAYRDGDRVVVLVPARFTRAEETRWVQTMTERLAAVEAERDALRDEYRLLVERVKAVMPYAINTAAWVTLLVTIGIEPEDMHFSK